MYSDPGRTAEYTIGVQVPTVFVVQCSLDTSRPV